MSDKGREAIAELNGLGGLSIEEFEAILRTNGWLHENDVVEGRTVSCPEKGVLMSCMDCENKHKTENCTRPATVGDILKVNQ